MYCSRNGFNGLNGIHTTSNITIYIKYKISPIIEKEGNVKGVIIRKDTHCNSFIEFVKLKIEFW